MPVNVIVSTPDDAGITFSSSPFKKIVFELAALPVLR